MLKKGFSELVFVAMPKATAGVLMLALNLALVSRLEPGEFGVFTLALSSVLLLDSVIGGAIDMSVLRLAPLRQAQDPDGARAIELAALLVKLGVVLAVIPLLAATAPWIALTLLHRSDATHVVWLIATCTAALLTMRSTLAHCQVIGDFRGYGAVDWANVLSRFSVAGVLLVIGTRHADAYIAAILVGPTSATLFNLNRIRIQWRLGWTRWKSEVPALLRHVSGYLPALAIGAVMARMDIYVLGARSDLVQVGMLGAALAIAGIPELLGSYMMVVLAPRVMPAAREGRLLAIFIRVQGALLAVSVLALLLAWLWLPDVLALLLPARFSAVGPVTLVLLLGGLAVLVALPFLMPLLLFLRPRFMFYLDAAFLIPTLAAYVLSIDAHGAIGAAWVTAISRLARTTISHFYALHVIHHDAHKGLIIDGQRAQPGGT